MSDTIYTRRAFLGKGLTLVSAGATVPLFLERTAWAVGHPLEAYLGLSRPGAGDGRVLVVVQLAGGNDGLNTVIPFENDRYYQARPRLGIAKGEVLRLNDDLGLHPRAEGLKALYDAGHLAVIQGVGYPNPNRSHFIATDIWSTASPDGRRRSGWIGRYVDCTCAGAARPSPRLGISITQEVPAAMEGERFSPISFADPGQLSWRGPAAEGVGLAAFNRLNDVEKGGRGRYGSDVPSDAAGALAYLQRAAMDARASAREIQAAARRTARPGRGRGRNRPPAGDQRGGPLGRQLTLVRRMITAGLGTKVYYVSMGGFDTHAGQARRHQDLLAQLGAALAGFVKGLKEDDLLDNVLVMTFSEFGRRVAENGSRGTDHGAAAPMFVMGSRVRPGLHGEHPSLEPDDLDRGDLPWRIDFRRVYASILKDWMKTDPTRILGKGFKRLALISG